MTAATLRLAEGLVQVNALGRFPVRGCQSPWRSLSWSGPVRSAGVYRPRRRVDSPASWDGSRSWRPCNRRWSGPGRVMAR